MPEEKVQKSKARKVVNAILTSLFILITVVMFVTLVMAIAIKLTGDSKKNTTWFFGIGFYQIISGSMEPELMIGDLIIAKKTPASELKVGDNIVFIYANKIVTHKVQELPGNGKIVTKGVANSSSETIDESDVIAKQILHIPNLGKVLDFARGPMGFVVVIALPLGALIIYQTISLGKRLKEYRKEAAEGAPVENPEELMDEIALLKAKLAAFEGGETQKADPPTAEETPAEENKPEEAEEITAEENKPEEAPETPVEAEKPQKPKKGKETK